MRVLGVVLLVGLLLFGGLLVWVGFAADLGYLEMSGTTLDASGTGYDYKMDLLVMDLLTSCEDGDGEDYTAMDYYLCAFLDGEGTVNLCVFEVQDFDNCFASLRDYVMDDTQQIGDCWVSGIYTFQEPDEEYYAEELELKEQWLADYGDELEAYAGERSPWPQERRRENQWQDKTGDDL